MNKQIYSKKLVSLQNNLKKFVFASVIITIIILSIILRPISGSDEGLVFAMLSIIKSVGNLFNIVFMISIFLLLKSKNVQTIKITSIFSIVIAIIKSFMILNVLFSDQSYMLSFCLENVLSTLFIILLIIISGTLLTELKNI